MINRNDKLELVYKNWKDILVKFIGAHIVFRELDLSLSIEEKLKKFGLPLLGFNYAIKFIPQTYIVPLEVNFETYMIIGDLSVSAPGVSFVAIQKDTGLIYRISRGKEVNQWTISYLNNSLEDFMVFLWEYCEFIKKYKSIGYASIEGNEILKDYNDMERELKSLDSKAMESNHYWDNMIHSIKSIYGDFLI